MKSGPFRCKRIGFVDTRPATKGTKLARRWLKTNLLGCKVFMPIRHVSLFSTWVKTLNYNTWNDIIHNNITQDDASCYKPSNLLMSQVVNTRSQLIGFVFHSLSHTYFSTYSGLQFRSSLYWPKSAHDIKNETLQIRAHFLCSGPKRAMLWPPRLAWKEIDLCQKWGFRVTYRQGFGESGGAREDLVRVYRASILFGVTQECEKVLMCGAQGGRWENWNRGRSSDCILNEMGTWVWVRMNVNMALCCLLLSNMCNHCL